MTHLSAKPVRTCVDPWKPQHELVTGILSHTSMDILITKEYFARAEAETGCKPNYLRSDGGGEYSSKEFEASGEWCCGEDEPNTH